MKNINPPIINWIALIAIGLFAASNPKNSLAIDRDQYGVNLVRKIISPIYNFEINRKACGVRPIYYCNGIMLSAFEKDRSIYWIDSAPGKFSMTYFQRETSNGGGGDLFGPVGYMLWPRGILTSLLDKNDDANVFSPEYRCIFPRDGDSDARADHGCGEDVNVRSSDRAKTAPCQSIGVNDVTSWLDNYRSSPAGLMCGFSLGMSMDNDDRLFAIAKQLQVDYRSEIIAYRNYDEVIMKTWVSFDPRKIPLLAFFYVKTGDDDELEEVRWNQLEYYRLTNIFAPIVRVLGEEETKPEIEFSYISDDQSNEIPKDVTVLPDVLSLSFPDDIESVRNQCKLQTKIVYECSTVFRVTDQDGNPMSGNTVNFELTGQMRINGKTPVITDTDGYATALTEGARDSVNGSLPHGQVKACVKNVCSSPVNLNQ